MGSSSLIVTGIAGSGLYLLWWLAIEIMAIHAKRKRDSYDRDREHHLRQPYSDKRRRLRRLARGVRSFGWLVLGAFVLCLVLLFISR